VFFPHLSIFLPLLLISPFTRANYRVAHFVSVSSYKKRFTVWPNSMVLFNSALIPSLRMTCECHTGPGWCNGYSALYFAFTAIKKSHCKCFMIPALPLKAMKVQYNPIFSPISFFNFLSVSPLHLSHVIISCLSP